MEDIDDKALVCRVCHRDLTFFQPIFARLSYVEKTLQELKNSIDGMQSIKPTADSGKQLAPNAVALRCILSVASSVLLASVFYWSGWHFETSTLDDKLLNFMSGFVPFFVAIYLGYQLPNLGSFSRGLIGFVSGALGFFQVLLIYSVFNSGRLNPKPGLLFLIYSVSGTVSFLSGSIIGRRQCRTDSPKAVSASSTLPSLLRDSPSAVQATELIKALAPIVLAILNAIFVAAGLAKSL